MLTNIKLIPVTSDSHPFATAVGKYNFFENGYLEDEYFMYGTANVYNKPDNFPLEIQHADLPYCNRFLVRRPSDISKYSGNILIEILNPTAAMDLDRMWVISGKHFMRRGDIYIGITSKPDVFDSLMNFDQNRYSQISWNYPYERTCKVAPVFEGLPKIKDNCETGLFWDMLTDLCKLFKSSDEMNPLKEYGKSKVMLTGWSQSAGYLYTYVKKLAFDAEYTKGHPLFDGYFAAGGVHFLNIPLNQDGFCQPQTSTEFKTVTYMPVPFISVQTESENALLGGYEARQDDSDSETLKYRTYEIPGSTHDTTGSLLDYYKDDMDVAKINMTPRYMGENEYPNDFPYEYPFNAAYEHFFNWVNESTAPPCFGRIEVDEKHINLVDKNGNAFGGMRTPFIDVPTCQYVPYSDYNGEKFGLFGHIIPFTANQLTKKYGSLENYQKLIEQAASDAIQKGALLKEDKNSVIAHALSFAQKRWIF